MKISHSIIINNNAEKVFYWVEDPEKARQWMTNVVHYEIIKETPNKVGTTFTETIEENGQQLEMKGEITEFIPNQKLAFFLESKVHKVDVVFNLESIDQNTLFTQNADIQFKGFMNIMIFLFGFFFKRKISNQTKYEFAKLKKLCEGSGKSE